MTKEVVIRLRDDLDGELGEDVATRYFSFDGTNYEIELSDNNYEDFRLDIKKWVQAAREARPRRKLRKANGNSAQPKKQPPQPHKATRGEMREWARQAGYEVSVRGNLSNEVREAYYKAHPRSRKGR
jgi:hypothetical protein